MKQHTTKNNQVQVKPYASITKREAKLALASSKIISLIRTNDTAWQLLQYAAWLKADNMPTEVLFHAMEEKSGVSAGLETLKKLFIFTPVEIDSVRGMAIDSDVQDLCFKYMSKFSNKSMKPDRLILSLFRVYDEILLDLDLQAYEVLPIAWNRNWEQYWNQARYMPQLEALFDFINSRNVNISTDKIMVKLRSKLASIYAYVLKPTLRDLNKSLSHSYEALKLFESSYPDKEQADLICIFNNLSTAYQALGDSEKAQQYHDQAVKVYGAQLYDAAASINKLGDDCYSSRDYKGAIMAHEQALKLYEGLYGNNYPHSDIITTLTKLSKAHCFPGNGKKALTYARQAAKICETLNGKESSDFAEALYNLGTVHGYCGNHQVSKECHEEALKIYKKLYDDRPSYIAITLNNQQLGNTNAF